MPPLGSARGSRMLIYSQIFIVHLLCSGPFSVRVSEVHRMISPAYEGKRLAEERDDMQISSRREIKGGLRLSQVSRQPYETLTLLTEWEVEIHRTYLVQANQLRSTEPTLFKTTQAN